MGELKTYYRIYADTKNKSTGILVAKQNDTKTRYLDVTITDNGVPIDLTGCEVRIYGRKKDGTEFYNNGSLQNAENGRCLFEATTQMLSCAGQNVDCEIVVYKNNQQILSTMPFSIFVVESLISSSAVESSNEYGALVVLFQNLYEAHALMTKMVESFGEAGKIATELAADTFWKMLEAVYQVNADALKNASVSEVLDRIGTTSDTGGTTTAGTAMAKLNELLKKMGSSVAGVTAQTKAFTEIAFGNVLAEGSTIKIEGMGVLNIITGGGVYSLTVDDAPTINITQIRTDRSTPIYFQKKVTLVTKSSNPVGYIVQT